MSPGVWVPLSAYSVPENVTPIDCLKENVPRPAMTICRRTTGAYCTTVTGDELSSTPAAAPIAFRIARTTRSPEFRVIELSDVHPVVPLANVLFVSSSLVAKLPRIGACGVTRRDRKSVVEG